MSTSRKVDGKGRTVSRVGDAEHVRVSLEHNASFYKTYYQNPLVDFRYDLIYRARRIAAMLARYDIDIAAPGFSLFEYGFGGGHLLNALRKASVVRGVEASEAAVSRLRQRWAHRHPDFRFEQWSDASQLPYGAAQFQLTICSHVLEHLEDDESALNELERVTVPGGHLLVILPANERLFPGSKHLRLYDVDEFSDRLAERGLVQVCVDEHQRFDRPWKHYRLILATRTSRLARVALSGSAALAFLPPVVTSWRLLGAFDDFLGNQGAPSTSIAYLYRKP